MSALRYLLALLQAGLLCALAVAQTPVPASQITGSAGWVLGTHVSVFEDPGGKLDIQHVMTTDYAQRFKPAGMSRPNFGYTRSAWWIRFTVEPGATDADLLFDVATPTLDSLHFYLPDSAAMPVQVSGDAMPWGQRSNLFRNPVFRLPLRGGVPQTAYMRVQTGSLMLLPMTLWQADAYIARDHATSLALFMCYGVILGLFLYNLVLYLSLRDRIYLYYVAYVGVFGLALTALDGSGFHYIWPNHPWWANQALATLVSLAHLAGILFARDFLDAGGVWRQWRRICNGYVVFFAILAACGASGLLLTQGDILLLMSFASPAGAITVLVFAAQKIRAGYRPARYLLLAWSALLLYMILAALRNFGIGADSALTAWGLHASLLIDVILLSTALAGRIRLMQSEAVTAQQRLIDTARTYQTALENRALELAEANCELESFSYTVAHDLRAPLRAIEGFSRMVEQDSAATLTPEARGDLLRISQNARHMAVLIDALLEFSRLGRHTITKQCVDMDALAAGEAAESASGGNVDLDIGALGSVMGDAALLRQVWANLIGNACKYSAKVAAPRIEVRCQRSAVEVIYSVRDNGAGFDGAYAGKLFNMFQRLHTAGEFEGAGIGLALVKRIVERHGGRVWAEGQPGSGACFWFALPIARCIA